MRYTTEENITATLKQNFDLEVSISGLFDCALFGIKSFFYLLHSFLLISKHLIRRPLEKDYFLNGGGLFAAVRKCLRLLLLLNVRMNFVAPQVLHASPLGQVGGLNRLQNRRRSAAPQGAVGGGQRPLVERDDGTVRR